MLAVGEVDPALEDSKDLFDSLRDRAAWLRPSLVLSPLVLALALGAWLLLWLSLARRPLALGRALVLAAWL